MLSIAKLKGAAAELVSYGENDASAATRDDYYTESGQAPAALIGGGWAALGIGHGYDRDAMIRALDGQDPRDGKQHAKAHPRRVKAFDLSFTADKSVSALWALGGDATLQDGRPIKQGIQDSHRAAVARTLQHLEQHVSFTRRGKAGIDLQRDPARLLATEYLHGSSRAGDPNLHTHVLVANLAERPDGRFGALDAQPLLRHKLAAGALYRAELAHGLQQMGLQIERHGEFIRVVGVPQALLDDWSKRREEIVDALNKAGVRGGKAAEIAALDTRDDKSELSASELQDQWILDAAEHGFDLSAIREILETGKAIQAAQQEPREMPTHADIVAKLTEHEAIITIHDIYRVVGVEAQSITNIDGIEAYVADLMHSRDLVRLTSEAGQEKFTSRELYTQERVAMRSIARMASTNAHTVSPEHLAAALARFEADNGFALSGEQRAAVAHVTGLGVAIVGAAGAGKSTALQAARLAWELAGYEVLGSSTSGKAAAELKKSAKIESNTIARLLIDLENGTRSLSARSVIVVDEAGMVDSRNYYALASAAEAAGAKIVFVGDHKQLQSVGAGGLFRSIVDRVGAAEITEVRRQREQWGRDLSGHLRNAEVAEGLQMLHERGLLAVEADRDAAIAEVVRRWQSITARDSDLSKTIVTADYNRDADRINAAVRDHLKSDLRIINEIDFVTCDREGNSTGTMKIGEGDRVLFRKNAKKIGMMNGDLATVTRINLAADGDHQIVARLDDGTEVVFRGSEYATLSHGYAVTTYKSQGASLEYDIRLGGGALQNEYVGGTRWRTEHHLVLIKDAIDRAADLELPSPKMIALATQTAHAKGIELDDETHQSFSACRDFLAEHDAAWKTEIAELLEVMSTSREKENTLEYSAVDAIDENAFDTEKTSKSTSSLVGQTPDLDHTIDNADRNDLRNQKQPQQRRQTQMAEELER